MLDCKKLLIFFGGIFKIEDKKLLIILGHLIIYNLYKIHLEYATTNHMTIFQKAMMANTSKSVVYLLIWYYSFAHPTKISIKKLIKITSGMIVTFSKNKLLFCNICVKAKIIRQPY